MPYGSPRMRIWRGILKSYSRVRKDGSHQRLSTVLRKSGILMDVHSISRKNVIAQHNQRLRFWLNGQLIERSDLVADELAAVAREDWRATDQARQVLSVVAGQGTSAPAAVWPDAAADGCAASAELVANHFWLQNLVPREKGRSSL
jgi:hypothetical protein